MEKLNLLDLLKGNPYPGRGIVLGKTPDGKSAVIRDVHMLIFEYFCHGLTFSCSWDPRSPGRYPPAG